MKPPMKASAQTIRNLAIRNSTNTLEGATGMMLALCGYVGGMRFFFGWECPKMKFFPFDGYTRSPRENALWLKGKSTRCAPILSIFSGGYFTKILPAIINAIAVYVIRLFARKSANHVKECESVRDVKLFLNTDANIPIRIEASSTHPDLRIFGMYAPCKNASLLVIAQKFSESFRGYVWPSHNTNHKVRVA